MQKEDIYKFIEGHSGEFTQISDEIWGYAETAFEEYRSVDRLIAGLEAHGFTVTRGVGGVETAFRADFGKGGPTIGFLGEFDALSGLSQLAGEDTQTPLVAGGNGHGCGHNMLGTAVLAAAVAAKEYIVKHGIDATLSYFGCPGEEGGSGKAFMAREGVFDDLDIAMCWHPAPYNAAMDVSTLANYQVKYKFKGLAAHAAAAPHLGRSALDAVELMNVGVNYLREHVIPEARMHYAITNTGGFSPNVVQPEAEVLYLIRAPKTPQVQEIYERINDIAKGAALMTGTAVEIDFVKACANIVPNKTLFGLMHKNLAQVGAPAYTEEELAFAKRMDESNGDNRPIDFSSSNLSADTIAHLAEKYKDKHMCEEVIPFDATRDTPVLPGSSDVGDVSWNVPTGQIVTACYSLRTAAHSWQLVSQGRTSLAHKGLLTAAKAIAASAVEAILHPEIIAQAKEEFQRQLGGEVYRSAIPKDVKPRAIGKL